MWFYFVLEKQSTRWVRGLALLWTDKWWSAHRKPGKFFRRNKICGILLSEWLTECLQAVSTLVIKFILDSLLTIFVVTLNKEGSYNRKEELHSSAILLIFNLYQIPRSDPPANVRNTSQRWLVSFSDGIRLFFFTRTWERVSKDSGMGNKFSTLKLSNWWLKDVGGEIQIQFELIHIPVVLSPICTSDILGVRSKEI